MKYLMFVSLFFYCGSTLNSVEAQQKPVVLPQHYAWFREPWTNVQADRSLKRIRVQVEKAFAATQDSTVLFRSYESAARKQPQNPRVLFARGCAALLTARDHPGDSSINHTIVGFAASDIDGATRISLSYEYSRLRFILMAYRPFGSPLRELGERLLKRDPNDLEVKEGLVDVLVYTSGLFKADKQEALRLINDVIRANPRASGPYTSRGGIYWFSWQRTKSESDRRNAIASYRTYLKLSKPSDKFRPRAQSILRSIQKG